MKKSKTSPIAPAPQKKLSFLRLGILIAFLIGTGYSSVFGWQWWKEDKVLSEIHPWFAAYVDVTSTPIYAFEQLGSTSTPQVVLSFIVSSKTDPCIPSWGTHYTMDEAGESLDLDRRIARLQQQEGKIAVSFGGLLNDELAVNCTQEEQLYQAYKSVIDRYNLDTIDLDLENTGLTNKEALTRRAKVIAQLQRDRRNNEQSLAIWLTLPVAPFGMTQDGTDAVAEMLAQGVDLAGVNVMTMDYGNSKDPALSMQVASEQALSQTHRQLSVLYKQAGINLNSRSIWRKIGATPMIGQNDVVAEVFTIDDAKGFNKFAREKGIGRMSMWSANRDRQCGENYVDQSIVSDSCSGIKQDPMAFTFALSEGFEGDLTQNATLVTIEDQVEAQVVDDPATSPYQIWQENGAYPAGVKVVWHGNVYEAKWWTKGDTPDNPVLQAWETPWQLIGPVLPGETPIEQPKLPAGTYPEWSGTDTYQAGQRVLFDGLPFQAKWWNQGESPAAAAANSDSSPWIPLSQAEIMNILEELGSQTEN